MHTPNWLTHPDSWLEVGSLEVYGTIAYTVGHNMPNIQAAIQYRVMHA